MQNSAMEVDKHSSTESFGESNEARRKYAKLTPELKHLFIRKIVMENLSIKQASELLRINYSSAKAIISAHRKAKFAQKKALPKKNATECQYRTIDHE